MCTSFHNNENLAQLKPYLSPDTLITDVGSVKSSIHDKVKELGLEKHFIGGHPMAGSEKSGFTNANPIILENAFYILTPTESSSEEDPDILSRAGTGNRCYPTGHYL